MTTTTTMMLLLRMYFTGFVSMKCCHRSADICQNNSCPWCGIRDSLWGNCESILYLLSHPYCSCPFASQRTGTSSGEFSTYCGRATQLGGYFRFKVLQDFRLSSRRLKQLYEPLHRSSLFLCSFFASIAQKDYSECSKIGKLSSFFISSTNCGVKSIRTKAIVSFCRSYRLSSGTLLCHLPALTLARQSGGTFVTFYTLFYTSFRHLRHRSLKTSITYLESDFHPVTQFDICRWSLGTFHLCYSLRFCCSSLTLLPSLGPFNNWRHSVDR